MQSEEVPALVFGPGLPPGGARGTLRASSLGIEVVAGELTQRADLASASLRSVGLEKPTLEVAWRDGADSWAAHVLDHAAAKRWLAQPVIANSVQGRKLQSDQRRTAARRGVGWTLLASYLLLPGLLLLLALVNAGTIAGWMAENISIEQEMRFGRQVFAIMRETMKVEAEGPAHDAVTTIVTKLTQGSKYRYDVHVSRDEIPNAYAMPGGVIVVNTGLIAATKRPEELAGALAHEVQHVEQRHSIRGMIKALGLRGLWALIAGDLGGTLAGQAALNLTSLKFSRDDESEADAMGFDALVRAGIDPGGMPEFFETMSKEGMDASVTILSTHPLSEDRKQEMERRVAELGNRSFAPLDFGAWPPVPATTPAAS